MSRHLNLTVVLLTLFDKPSRVKRVDISTNLQKEDWFLEINPNGHIPALTDSYGGKNIRLFDSGSIMQYLVEKDDKNHKISYPKSSPESDEVNNYLFF